MYRHLRLIGIGRRAGILSTSSSHCLLHNVRLFGSSQLDQQRANDINDDEDTLMAEVHEANERCFGHVQLKVVNEESYSLEDQWGVFASRPFSKGCTVISSAPITTPTTFCSHSIQIDYDKHILMELPARFLNHSCDPNIGVGGELNDRGSYDFVALRGIDAGEVRNVCLYLLHTSCCNFFCTLHHIIPPPTLNSF